MAKTHWKKLTNPNYLGAYSLEDGQDLVLTIAYVRQESVTGADGKREDCAVCHFKERDVKPMILNKTNMKTIAKVLGSQYVEDWAGHQIQIGSEIVNAFGSVTEALRVRAFLPREQKTIPCEHCGTPVQAGHGMSAEQMAEYTRKKYGAALCAKCATAAAQRMKADAEQRDVADDHDAEGDA